MSRAQLTVPPKMNQLFLPLMLSGDPDKFGETLVMVASVYWFGCILEKQTTAFSTTASKEVKLILPITCNLKKNISLVLTIYFPGCIFKNIHS